MSEVPASEFNKQLSNTAQVMRNLADGVLAVEPRNGHNSAEGSVGRAEIEDVEPSLPATRWTEPFRDVHSLGGITLFAAADYVRGYAQLFSGPHASVFSHLIVTRGCLEAAVVAQWLSDPTIEPLERLRRGLWEQSKSAGEWASIAGTPSDTDDATESARKSQEKADAIAAKKRWVEQAKQYGWCLAWKNDTSPQITEAHLGKDGRYKVLTDRPWMATAVDKLLLGKGNFALGRMEWNYLSAVDHVTWYALRQAIVGPPTTTGNGPSLAGVGTDATSVLVRAQLILRAVRIAANSRFVLMGWDDSDWRAVAALVERHEKALYLGGMKLRRSSGTT